MLLKRIAVAFAFVFALTACEAGTEDIEKPMPQPIPCGPTLTCALTEVCIADCHGEGPPHDTHRCAPIPASCGDEPSCSCIGPCGICRKDSDRSFECTGC